MSDLIYRQAASYALNTIRVSKNETWYSFYQKVLDVFSKLPSAEPYLDEWCTDCKEYDHERHCCPRWNRVIRETLKDVERKKGKWIDEGFYADGHGAHAFRCPECGGHIIEYDADPFCKWCGADMRGDENG